MDNSLTRREIEEQLIIKAWQDDNFKQDLVNDPKTVLGREGINLPDSIEIRVVQEDANVFYLVIPAQPTGEGTLSEAELESIAGGRSSSNNGICWGNG